MRDEFESSPASIIACRIKLNTRRNLNKPTRRAFI
jgi:hypothetical protein